MLERLWYGKSGWRWALGPLALLFALVSGGRRFAYRRGWFSTYRASLPVIVGVRDKGLRPGDVVADPMLQEALSVLEICNQSAMRRELTVASIDLSSEDQIGVGLMSGEQVLLSRGRLEEKLRQLPIMRAVARQKGLELAVYDMTVDRNYVGRPTNWVESPAEAAP